MFVLLWLLQCLDPACVRNVYFHSTVEHAPDQIEENLVSFTVLSEEQGEADCHPDKQVGRNRSNHLEGSM